MSRAVRSAICLALLGAALLIAGATGLASASRLPGSCPAQRPNSPTIGSGPCARSSSGGWHDVGAALLPLGVLALIGAGVLAVTAPRSTPGKGLPPREGARPAAPGQHS
jgi:hypothetical protein